MAFDAKILIEPLLNNGFRPDMVAYLLGILAEVLLNYNEAPVKAQNTQGKPVLFPAIIGVTQLLPRTKSNISPRITRVAMAR